MRIIIIRKNNVQSDLVLNMGSVIEVFVDCGKVSK